MWGNDDWKRETNLYDVRKIFVGGLKAETVESDVRNYFQSFGVVTSVVLIYCSNTGRSRGFGFVEFEERATVDEVVLKYHEIGGKEVDVKQAVKRTAMAKIVGAIGGAPNSCSFRGVSGGGVPYLWDGNASRNWGNAGGDSQMGGGYNAGPLEYPPVPGSDDPLREGGLNYVN